MLQGTGSDVGKSLLVAGLCRAYTQRGLKVRPFKPQNMSNNAAVVPGGGEIGRAQALQARAAGAEPSVHMNPVLLKPQSDVGAQVIVQGRVTGNASARDYHGLKKDLLPRVLESFRFMKDQSDLVVVEGAGSAAEINLRDADIANMGFATAAHVPVVLVGDIDRGGVIASLIGTHELLSGAERALVRGYIINKFRGDASLFEDAVEMIKARSAMDCFGIVPFFPEARFLPKEDAMALDSATSGEALEYGSRDNETTADLIKIAVPRLARIANFDDLDPLRAESGVHVQVIEPGRPLPGDADVVLIPGSKSTLADLKFLRGQGWDTDIAAHRRRGGMVVGLCGGFQMLGKRVADPDGIEGPPGDAPGLGLLDLETVISGDKALEVVRGVEEGSGEPVHGYEMHIGLTEGPARARPWFMLDDGRREGAVSEDGLVRGSYLHGVFAADAFRYGFLSRLRSGHVRGQAFEARVEDTLDKLAAHLETHLDLDRLLAAAE